MLVCSALGAASTGSAADQIAASPKTFLGSIARQATGDVPQIVNPAEELAAFDSKGILRWSAVAGADAYEVWAYGDAELTQAAEFSGALSSRQYQFTQLAGEQTYYVKIYYRVGGAWQEMPAFTLTTTTNVVRSRLLNSQEELEGFGPSGMLRWTTVAGADVYELWIYRDAQLVAFAETSGPVRITQYRITSLTPGKTYYARVYARANGQFTAGDALPLTVTAEQNRARIMNPQEELDAFATNGILRWSPVTGATAYELWIFTDPNSANFYEASGSLSERNYATRTLQPGRAYYAQAYSLVSGQWQVGSPVKVTTTGQVTKARLTNPQAELESFSTTGTLRWTEVPGASAYEIWIYGNAGLGRIVESGANPDRSYTVRRLCSGATYYVQVYAQLNGEWTTGWPTRLDVAEGTAAADCVPPAPVISVTADSVEVLSGESVMLRWSSKFATSCTASGAWTGERVVSGQELVGPISKSSLFTLTCSGKSGASKAETLVTIKGTSAGPAIGVSPMNLSFGSQTAGTTSAVQAVTVTNTGTAVLNIGSITLGGIDPASFATTTSCGASLAVGASCAVSVTFGPGTAGAKSASLSITHNASGSPTVIGLSGTGVATPVPAISVTSASLSFGEQTTGTTSAAQSVTVTNTGTAALTLNGFGLTGTDTESFVQTTTCGASLAVGASCTVSVTFTPSTTGAKSASLSITHNAGGSPTTVPLSGTGVPVPVPGISVTPGSVPFGEHLVGTTSAAQKVTVTNTGTAPLTIGSIELAGADAASFAKASTCGESLVAGAVCTVTVTFSPSATGARSANVSISHNASGSPTVIGLSGTGVATPVPAISVTPASLSFGEQTTGTTSAAQSVTVTNAGTAALALNGFGLTGTDTESFAQTTACGASLAVGASCTVSVTFSPATTGAKSASLGITHNASGSPTTVALSGSGIAPLEPAISVSPATLSFGDQTTGTTSAAHAVTVTNTGTAILTLNGFGLTGSDSGAFAQTTTCGASLAVGASCTLSVTFTPATTGAKSASLSITHNAGGSPTTVPLSGSGTSQPGDSEANPAISPAHIRAANPSAPSGVYWFDPDGAGSNAPFQAYADMTTAGGGWLQVRRVAAGNNWYPGNDDLRGTDTYNATSSSTYNASQHWGVKFDYFVDANTEYLFAAGDNSAWCVIQRGANDFGGTSSIDTRGTTVVDSAGVAVMAGGLTNVLLRTLAEDPWIGCEGTHNQNQPRMLYGEASYPVHVGFKDAHEGINIFVRGRPLVGDPATLSFGDQQVGASSAARLVMVTNVGLSALSISGIAISGLDGGAFAQTTSCVGSLAVGGSCMVSVTFSPATTGAKSAALSIAHNASGSPTVIGLSGTGVAIPVPSILVSPSSLSFGDQTTGTASAARALTLTNTGSAVLSLDSLGFSGVDSTAFGLSTDCGASLAVGASCTVSVTFTPATTGAKSAALSIAHNASGSPTAVALSGSGIAPLEPAIIVSPSSLSFGDQTTGTTSAAQAVTVSNTGTAALTISGINLAGTDAASFGKTTSCGSSVAAGGSCTISVTFAPATTGAKSSTISISHDAAGSPSVVALSGTGMVSQPEVVVTPIQLSFGSQLVSAASGIRIITISNPGSVPLNISDIALSGSDSGAFDQQSNCGTTLDVNASCKIEVSFLPSTVGYKSSTVVVSTNAGSRAVSLQGAGVDDAAIVFTTESLMTSADARYPVVGFQGDGSLVVGFSRFFNASAMQRAYLTLVSSPFLDQVGAEGWNQQFVQSSVRVRKVLPPFSGNAAIAGLLHTTGAGVGGYVASLENRTLALLADTGGSRADFCRFNGTYQNLRAGWLRLSVYSGSFSYVSRYNTGFGRVKETASATVSVGAQGYAIGGKRIACGSASISGTDDPYFVLAKISPATGAVQLQLYRIDSDTGISKVGESLTGTGAVTPDAVDPIMDLALDAANAGMIAYQKYDSTAGTWKIYARPFGVSSVGLTWTSTEKLISRDYIADYEAARYVSLVAGAGHFFASISYRGTTMLPHITLNKLAVDGTSTEVASIERWAYWKDTTEDYSSLQCCSNGRLLLAGVFGGVARVYSLNPDGSKAGPLSVSKGTPDIVSRIDPANRIPAIEWSRISESAIASAPIGPSSERLNAASDRQSTESIGRITGSAATYQRYGGENKAPLSADSCGVTRLGAWTQHLSRERSRSDASTYSFSIAEQRSGGRHWTKLWLGVGVDYDLAGSIKRPGGSIARCGTATYAWRDGYAPEVWSLSRSLIPLWTKALLEPSSALAVTGTSCAADDAFVIVGITEGRDSAGAPNGELRQVRIAVSPYDGEAPVPNDLGPWTGDLRLLGDSCISVE